MKTNAHPPSVSFFPRTTVKSWQRAVDEKSTPNIMYVIGHSSCVFLLLSTKQIAG